MTSSDQPSSSHGLKMALEYGPLILFFVVNSFYGIYTGTAVLVAATVLSLSISWVKTRTIPKILAFGCAAVVFFWADLGDDDWPQSAESHLGRSNANASA